jgi:hypothetical protein
MNEKNNNDVIAVRSINSRYIMIDEDIFQQLTGNELKIYMAIRFESDYSKRCSEVELSIQHIMNITKLSRAKIFDSLNKLEFSHFIIKRINYQNHKRGKVNAFLVARDYLYFKQIDTQNNTHPENDTGVQSQDTRPESGLTRPDSGLTRPENDILIDQQSFQHSFHHDTYISTEQNLNNNQDHKTSTLNTDYEYPETLYPLPEKPKLARKTSKSGSLKREQLVESNPHNIPDDMLEEWLTARRAKRALVTARVWHHLNLELSKCVNAIEAFETMLIRGWSTLNAEWVKNIKTPVKANSTNDDWVNGIANDLF